MPKYDWQILRIKEAVSMADSYSGTLRLMDSPATSGTRQTLKRFILVEGLTTSHFKGQAHGRAKSHKWEEQYVLMKNSGAPQRTVKRFYKAMRDRMGRTESCDLCGLPPIWNDQALCLELDHIDGNNHNHEVSNLRLLCPNCHSQAPTSKKR